MLRSRPTLSFASLTLALSWGGVLLATVGDPFPAEPERAQARFALVFIAMLIGPSVAGVALTALTGGRQAIGDLRSRLFTWRLPTRWYAIALLTAPLALAITLAVLLLVPGQFVPAIASAGRGADAGSPIVAASVTSLMLQALAVGALAGFFEELGWTGFALPGMSSSRAPLGIGVRLGALWGLWHLVAIWWGSASAIADVPLPLYLAVALFSFLVPYRVLMVALHERTGSLLLAVLMHASLTASMLLLGPSVSGGALLVFDLSFGAVLWTMVALTPTATLPSDPHGWRAMRAGRSRGSPTR